MAGRVGDRMKPGSLSHFPSLVSRFLWPLGDTEAKGLVMLTQSLTASAGDGTGHIESNQYTQSSPTFRPSFPNPTQEPSVPTKMVAQGPTFQRLNSPTHPTPQSAFLQPPPAGTPRPIISTPSSCAAGVLRNAASWFEPNNETTQDRHPPAPGMYLV